MKKTLFITLTLCLAQLMQAAKVEKDVTVKVGGESRKYKLYVPNSAKDNCPLVLSLHGAGGQNTAGSGRSGL